MTGHYLLPTYNRQPLAFARGEGCWLYDHEGTAYLDALSGIGVSCLGHTHPAMVRTIQQQAASLIHTSNIYRIPEQEQLAEKLCQLSGMDKVFFGNSGAEANEAAIKLARLYGHQRSIDNPAIIVMEGAFHGRTLATLSATASRKVQAGFEPLVSGFIRVPFNDVDAVAKVLQNNKAVVAILAEPIQGEGGVQVPAHGYLETLRDLCDQHELLLMLDEVQTGNGRTGTYFAFQHEQLLPDVLCTAKGLGGGFPISACLVSGRATHVFSPGNHGSTYGGNPLGCAVALTVAEQVEAILDRVVCLGESLRHQLQQQLSSLSFVREIRGKGLMTGIQLDLDCPALVDLAREEKLLINVTAGSVIRLLPPLVINEAEIEQLVARLSAALQRFAQQQDAS